MSKDKAGVDFSGSPGNPDSTIMSEAERTRLENQVDFPSVKVSYFTLYTHASKKDLLIILLSAILAIAGGASKPFMTIIFGQVAVSIKDYTTSSSIASEFASSISQMTLYLVYLGIGQFFAIFLSTAGFIRAGEHITQSIRKEYLAALLRQNIAFFDQIGTGDLSNAITTNTNTIQDAISQNVPLALAAVASFLSAFVISFMRSWKLALILSSTVFAIISINVFGAPRIMRFRKETAKMYNASGVVAEEGISSMRDLIATGSQEKMALRYDGLLKRSTDWGLKGKVLNLIDNIFAKLTQGGVMGLMICVVYLNYGLAFWMGSRYIVSGEVELGDVLIILLAMMVCASLGETLPHMQAFGAGVAAAGRIFDTIARVPAIRSNSSGCLQPEKFEGSIELRGIRHIYPSRPEALVLDDFNLVIPAGKTTALVGTSGSGKSTIVGLLERFYDPISGEILLDGINISKMDLKYLRKQISVVSQDPTLFDCSIFENIEQGLVNSGYVNLGIDDKTRLIEDAAKLANAHEFILNLPQGYQSQVGQHGHLLSGGQKQRIAIARAVVKQPAILLLDEPTSALDNESERIVQLALEKASFGRTTITVAHKLSTIERADNIVVLEKGRIIEQGEHSQLMAQRGTYFKSVITQTIITGDKTPIRDEEMETESESMSDLDCQLLKEKGKVEIPEKETSKAVQEDQSSKTPLKFSFFDLIRFIASFNKPDALFMCVGLSCSVVTGLATPVHSIFFANLIASLSLPESEYANLRHNANFWSLMYLTLAFIQVLAFIAQGFTFGICSERLIYRSRSQSYRHILRQPLSFFDAEGNSIGALTTFLSTQTTNLAGLSGTTLGTLLSLIATLLGAIILSLIVAWKLALVCTATVPLLLACGFLRVKMLSLFAIASRTAYESSASLALEAISSIRTVTALSLSSTILSRFSDSLAMQQKTSLPSILKSSCLYALSQSLIYWCLALGFWYGSQLIANGEYNMLQFYIVFMAITYGVQSAGAFFAFAPDIGKAKQAAQELKTLFCRTPEIDIWSSSGTLLETVQGEVEFENVSFSYEGRQESQVLNSLSFTAKAGEYIALVGSSGCGKSTAISLLERFYDPTTGRILLDGTDIKDVNINNYRSHIALVGQEPTLYQGTIRENVMFGVVESEISESTFLKACHDAAIYDFVMSLPDGYNTKVGSKGVLLSGGQRQRIAIARALIRQPRILLLDEATSALDSTSEESVQNALDSAAKGRTTIVVAHRLSTIKNADKIYVLDKGRVVEEGTNLELLALKGRYWRLASKEKA
ncbi:hypothetical protein HYFRA_00014076 [Hymenoscyphus fraxineus]|uniref:Uncharacterized protein n=1 Tax=Hymenoscyphus fraxineus TaxID=746836 RepID=A0A9N9LE01_9HELO|nr:hypothetical protein HYFRA_00014076 [Hymenoscyphus fraxineus]